MKPPRRFGTRRYIDAAVAAPSFGVTDGSNAAAGQIGEYMSGSLTNTGIANNSSVALVGMTLTPGDWDVEGNAVFSYQTGAGSTAILGISTTQTGVGALGGQARITVQNNSLNAVTLATGAQRFSVASNTAVYLVGNSQFTTSTCTVAAIMRARRMR